MLNREKTILVAIDLQDKLLPAMNSEEGVVAASKKLVEGAEILNVPYIFTQQYTKGLGETNEDVRSAVKGEFTHVEKNTFSAYLTEGFVDTITASGRKQVVLFGVETHVCVLQTALDLMENGYEVHIVADCVSSRFESDEIIALERMKEAGAVVTTAETVLFELLKGSKEAGFKEISNLVK